jgi:hypothetical protein
MSRDRRRTIRRKIRPGRSRRGFLKTAAGATIVLGAAAGILSTKAFSTVGVPRGVDIGVASPENALLGIDARGPVKKNSREPMVQLTNNTDNTLSITVTLDDCSDGTIYDNAGGSGCSVTFSLASGNTDFVDIQASFVGTIPFSVSASSAGFDISTSSSVEAQPGNVPGAVLIQLPNKNQDFSAQVSSNLFEVSKVDIRDDDGDNDLDLIEFRVREGSSAGTVIGAYDVTNPPGDRYNPTGNPAVTFSPNAGYSIKSNTTYSLTIKGLDADGNWASETFEHTTSGGGGGGPP